MLLLPGRSNMIPTGDHIGRFVGTLIKFRTDYAGEKVFQILVCKDHITVTSENNPLLIKSLLETVYGSGCASSLFYFVSYTGDMISGHFHQDKTLN